jgi:hypothetical protein
LTQTEEPFQAAALHPRGRHPFRSGVKVEGGTHADLHGLDSISEVVGKKVLFRRTQAYEHDLRPAVTNPLNDISLLAFRERAERR